MEIRRPKNKHGWKKKKYTCGGVGNLEKKVEPNRQQRGRLLEPEVKFVIFRVRK